MCNEVRGLSIAMMEELAEEVQLRFPGEKVHMHLLITIYYAARSDHAKRLLAATNDIHNRDLVNYLVNLKEELIQGCPVEPHKYIRNVWRSIFKNEAADCYSYTAKGRSKRRAIKKYLFTNIFQESFLKRFPGMDDIFFIDNTMRFFIYEHNVMSKSLRNKQKLQTGTEPRVQNEAFTDDEMEEQIFHDDEDSIL